MPRSRRRASRLGRGVRAPDGFLIQEQVLLDQGSSTTSSPRRWVSPRPLDAVRLLRPTLPRREEERAHDRADDEAHSHREGQPDGGRERPSQELHFTSGARADGFSTDLGGLEPDSAGEGAEGRRHHHWKPPFHDHMLRGEADDASTSPPRMDPPLPRGPPKACLRGWPRRHPWATGAAPARPTLCAVLPWVHIRRSHVSKLGQAPSSSSRRYAAGVTPSSHATWAHMTHASRPTMVSFGFLRPTPTIGGAPRSSLNARIVFNLSPERSNIHVLSEADNPSVFEVPHVGCGFREGFAGRPI